jgi:serine/threonine-protein kinase
MMIELRVLGTMDVGAMRSRSASALLAQPKRCALLTYLALARPRGFHRRDKLLGLFWPEADAGHARSALRSASYFLRQSLGDAVLVSRGDTELGVDSTALWCDATAFEDAVSAGRAEEGLALYRGPLLDGFFLADAPEFERWLEEERARLHARAAQAAWQLAEQAESAGNVMAAVKWARQAAGFFPDDEPAARRLIECLNRNGDRTGALRFYEAFALRLKQEYELELSADTHRLAESIRRRAGPAVEAPREAATPVRPVLALTESAVDSTTGKTRARFGRRGSPVRIVIAAALAVLAVVVMAQFWMSPGNPVIATNTLMVLPFDAARPNEPWREDLVAALALNLDGAGGLRVIDSRVTLNGLSALDKSDAPPTLEDLLTFAVRKGARYVLTGRLIPSGDRVRVVAEVHDAVAQKRLRVEQVEGAIDSVLVLADRISVNLLRHTILAGVEVSQLDERRIETGVPGAIKAFLEGERYFRRSKFRDAGVAYRRAVAADSAFAFAWYRLYQACYWALVACGDRDPRYYLAQVRRHAGRLPVRDREIVEATLEPDRSAAIARMQQVTMRWPDDVEGWYLLGEWTYLPLLKRPYPSRQQALANLTRATELDPLFGPAYVLLLTEAFARQDTLEAAELIGKLARIDATNESALGFALAFDLAFGTSAQRAAARNALDTASTLVLRHAYFNNGSATCCAHSPALWESDRLVEQALTAERHDPVVRRAAGAALVLTYMARGRFREADSIFATIPADQLRPLELMSILAGRTGLRADSTLMRRASHAAALFPNPYFAFANASMAMFAGNIGEAELGIDKLEAIGTAGSAALAQSLRALKAGDTLQAVQELEKGLVAASGPGGLQLRYDMGRMWLRLGDPKLAREYFEAIELRARALNAPIEFYLGQVNERLGNFNQARLHYARFVDWWKDCDPEVRPLWEEGRKGLARVEKRP